jgi:DNA-binding CsgD family transcriptional regulator
MPQRRSSPSWTHRAARSNGCGRSRLPAGAGRCSRQAPGISRLPSAISTELELHDDLGQPFERGRTLLVLGTLQRRDRKKQAARTTLTEALAVFDELGARLWSEKARAELARIGGRAAAPGTLTPTEERVAALLAAGHTYREVGEALFISPKTVHWNVSKIYRKLGVRSRTELAARLAAHEAGEQSPATRPVPD